MNEEYIITASAVKDEIKIKGSRFIGELYPVVSQDEAENLLTRCRKEYHDATHHCYAYRIGEDASVHRYSDDGEPSGTAGKPILSILEHAGITNSLLIVIRYFGGTKLGTGGLVRAYTDAAQALIRKAEIRRVPVLRTLHITFPYDYTSGVMRVIAQHSLKIEDTEYGDDVTIRLAVRPSQILTIRREMTDATAGTIAIGTP
jgi:uncharacterized YigZ family protein